MEIPSRRSPCATVDEKNTKCAQEEKKNEAKKEKKKLPGISGQGQRDLVLTYTVCKVVTTQAERHRIASLCILLSILTSSKVGFEFILRSLAWCPSFLCHIQSDIGSCFLHPLLIHHSSGPLLLSPQVGTLLSD